MDELELPPVLQRLAQHTRLAPGVHGSRTQPSQLQIGTASFKSEVAGVLSPPVKTPPSLWSSSRAPAATNRRAGAQGSSRSFPFPLPCPLAPSGAHAAMSRGHGRGSGEHRLDPCAPARRLVAAGA